ncbi:hypothetical protein IQ225_17260 [Synechocystis salina LEGE 06155]|jgi:hypothetical protein|nr:hypothetical protein [Synechocystis salina LEGE 06155]
MLKSYEAIYENGQIKWLSGQPEIETAKIIITVLEERKTTAPKRRTFPVPQAGKVEILGDIISPIVDEEDWECLR